MYLPEIGRFTSFDSFEAPPDDLADANKYLYCAADPVNGSDPTGRSELTETLATVTLVGALAAFSLSPLRVSPVRNLAIAPPASTFVPQIVSVANSHLNSLKWREDIDGVNKCNFFVADVLVEAGYGTGRLHTTMRNALVPTAGDWANPYFDIPHWHIIPGGPANAQPGDILAQAINYSDATGHVGIVVGPRQLASASSVGYPEGIITISDYGFRPAGSTDKGEGEIENCVIRRYSDAP